MPLFDSLKTKEYFSNYEALLDGRPLPHGNLAGKTLDKDAYFKDFSDYEVLLRNDVPEKYWKYFSGKSSKFREVSDNDDSIEIEVGRGPVNLSPQRRSLWSNDGIKETKTDELNINLGNLKLNSKDKQNDATAAVADNFHDSSFKLEFESDELFQKPKKVDFLQDIRLNDYKRLPNKANLSEADKRLELLTNELVKENSSLRLQNDSLKKRLDAANDIISYEADVYDAIRKKLKGYVNKYNKAVDIIKQLERSNEKRTSLSSSSLPPESSIKNKVPQTYDNIDKDDISNMIPEVQTIDEQISKLKQQRSKLISDTRSQLKKQLKSKKLESASPKSTVVNINIPSELLSLLTEKVMNIEHAAKPDPNCTCSSSASELPPASNEHEKFHPNIQDCPFCDTKSSSPNEIDNILKNSNISRGELDTLLKYLTDRVCSNISSSSHPSSNEPEIW